jgi:hypothetical protein
VYESTRRDQCQPRVVLWYFARALYRLGNTTKVRSWKLGVARTGDGDSGRLAPCQ